VDHWNLDMEALKTWVFQVGGVLEKARDYISGRQMMRGWRPIEFSVSS